MVRRRRARLAGARENGPLADWDLRGYGLANCFGVDRAGFEFGAEARRFHYLAEGGGGGGREAEVAGTVYAFGDAKGGPAQRVLTVPGCGAGTFGGERQDSGREMFVGGAVHGGFAFVIDGVDVIAKSDGEADGFDDLGFGAGVFVGRTGTDSGGGHKRGGVIGVG